jgi:uracil phosphoribosyltransferase
MLFVLTQDCSIANQFLVELRDKDIQQDRARFRKNMTRLGEIMAYEISKKLEYKNEKVETSLGMASSHVHKDEPVLLTVLRAGLPYFQGFQNFFGKADSGFIGAYRKEGGDDITIKLDYLSTPILEGRDLILIDPMLATGKSFVKALNSLGGRGKPKHVYLASVVASPEGVAYLEEHVKIPFSIWTVALDEGLNDQFYIVPGLGDAGDLSFGEKI